MISKGMYTALLKEDDIKNRITMEDIATHIHRYEYI